MSGEMRLDGTGLCSWQGCGGRGGGGVVEGTHYSVTSSRTMLTYISKPFSVPTSSRSPFKMICTPFSPPPVRAKDPLRSHKARRLGKGVGAGRGRERGGGGHGGEASAPPWR